MLTKLEVVDYCYHFGDKGEAPNQGQDQRKHYVCWHTHILKLPDTTVTKKNKLMLKSFITASKHNVDDKDNELPLDHMVTPKKAIP